MASLFSMSLIACGSSKGNKSEELPSSVETNNSAENSTIESNGDTSVETKESTKEKENSKTSTPKESSSNNNDESLEDPAVVDWNKYLLETIYSDFKKIKNSDFH